MTRLTVFLAVAALAAAPPSLRGQNSGGTPGAQPSRRVDECGAPASQSRNRRNAPRPANAGTSPAGATQSGTAPAGGAQGPRLLGVSADSAAAQATAAGQPGAANPQASSTSQGSQFAPAGAVAPQASSTSMQTAQAATSAGGVCLANGAGGGTSDPRNARVNRDALQLGLGSRGDRVRLGPAASVSVPTAFGVDAGEMFFGVAYQGRTRYTDASDAAAVVGLGIGTRRIVAVEAALTTYSTIRGEPLETGGVSFKIHRALPRQTSVAVGWENAILWGRSDDDGSLYGVVTKMMNLREDPAAAFSTAVFTVGVGNGRFRFEDDDAEGNETVNLFAAAGARVTPRVSVVADWTGQDLNAAASLTPVPRLPVVITVGMADLTGLAGDGARFILSLGYGLAFRQPF